jgi:hypothetical protein
MVLHNPTRTLVAGTYGRSAFKLDVSHIVGVEVSQKPYRLSPLELYQNKPNPFQTNTGISFRLPRKSEVLLEIFNSAGAVVRTLEHRSFGSGVHEVVWDGRDGSGKPLPAGSYIYRLRVGGRAISKRMVLLR